MHPGLDLETTLDRVAIDHYNTGHPHSHIVIRGVTDQGKILYIASDYIAYGIHHRARELVTLRRPGPFCALDQLVIEVARPR